MRKIIYVIGALLIFCGPGLSLAAMQVFVSIPPQKWVIEGVGGEAVEVQLLVNKGQDPHAFEPSPKQVAALSKSRIWFTMGMEFEEQLMKKIREVAPNLRIVDMAAHVHRIAMVEADHDEHGRNDGEAVQDDHAEHHDYSEDTVDNHSHHGHYDHKGQDPHVWLSPVNLQVMAAKVRDALKESDTSNAALYSKNADELRQELERLHAEIRKMLAPYRGASFYVFHPSFGYFAHAYGLEQHAIETGGKSPSPRQLSALIEKARSEKVKVIFVQPQFDPKSARAVAASIGGEVVPLDALAEDVPENLKTMADNIASALAP